MLHAVRAIPEHRFTPAATSLAVAGAAASVMGLAAVFAPELTVLGILGLAVLFAFVRAPAWILVIVVVAILAGAEVARSELIAAGVAESTAGLLGLGRVSLVLALLTVARIVLRREVPRIPTGVAIALCVYVLSLLIQAQVSMVRGTALPLLADLQREIAFMSTFLIGLIAVQSSSHRVRLYRGFAIVALLCSVGSTLYWSWASGWIAVPPGLATIFEHAQARVAEQGVAATRAQFPFVFMHPNLAGFVFVSMGVFAIPPLLDTGRRSDRMLALVLLAATAAGVLSTQSRTALIALAGGTVVYLVLTRGIAMSARVLMVGAILIVGFVVWTVYSLLPDSRALTNVRTLESRGEIWRDAFELFAEAPLLGNGFLVSTLGVFGGSGGRGQSVHNEYLGRLVDGGLIGFALWLFVLGTFAVIALSLWRSHGSRSAEGTSLIAFLVVLGLTMLTNAPWSSGTTPIFIWLFLGIGTGSFIAETADRSTAQSGQRARSVSPP